MQAINARHLRMATSVLAIGQLLVSTNRCENGYINHSFMFYFCPTTTANCSHDTSTLSLRIPTIYKWNNRDGVFWLPVIGAWGPWWQNVILVQNRPCFLLRLFDWQLLLKHQWQRLQQYPPNLGSGWICFAQLGLAHISPTRLCAPTGAASTRAASDASGMSSSSGLSPDDIPEAEDNQTASPLEIDILSRSGISLICPIISSRPFGAFISRLICGGGCCG